MKHWWKILGVLILIYVHIGGLLFDVPRLDILNETVRALYFHVPMWFSMVVLYTISLVYAILYLKKPSDLDEPLDLNKRPDLNNPLEHDIRSEIFAKVGTAFGILGILTGMLWANYTWGSPWHGDPKQNGAAIALLVYLAYFVLRGSIDSDEQKARLSAVYNIFAFAAMIPLIFIIPRLTSSMHPGSGGNPGFNAYDLDSRMRLVFYPAVAGWILVGVWIATLIVRYRFLLNKINEAEDEQDR